MPAYVSPNKTLRSVISGPVDTSHQRPGKLPRGFLGRPRRGRAIAVVCAAAISVLVTGCSSTVATSPGPHAADKKCAEVIAALHGSQSLAGLQRHEVTGQSTAAWGEPAVTLRCGVPTPPPSTDGCVSIDDVDWAGPRDPKANDRKYTTYGRSPAVEVFIPVGSPAAPHVVLNELGPVVRQLPVSRKCI